MEINVDEEKKIAMIWLTLEESAFYRQNGRDFLQPLLDSYAHQKIKPAIFLSGTAPILPIAQDLLRRGQKILAEQALQEQKL